jgi:glycosyltransferase involved in cell wall biosynthesis
MNMNKLIIIPAYNESMTIGTVLHTIKRISADVLIIDNASTDITLEVVKIFEKYYTRDLNLDVIEHKTNLGKAQSLKEGFQYAIENGYTYIITIDGDMEHDPWLIPKFFEKLDDYDVVLGQRNKYRSGIRRILNKWSGLWFNLLIPGIKDIQCGYRGFKVELLKKLKLESDGFEIEMEVLLEAIKNNANIAVLEIDTKPKQHSNLTIIDYIYMNNFFDRWVIKNRKQLKLPIFKKSFLICGSGIGLLFGSIIETFKYNNYLLRTKKLREKKVN